MPIQAIWNDTVIAETSDYKIVEGHYYFPPESVKSEHLQKNGGQYTSRWKGVADYYDVVIGDKINKEAALVYANPDKEIMGIKNHFFFCKDVEIIKIDDKR